MLRTVRHIKEELRERLHLSAKHNRANLSAEFRSSGLSRHKMRDAEKLQPAGDVRDHRRLAASVNALEGDQLSAHEISSWALRDPTP
jgi:hypothetical protein